MSSLSFVRNSQQITVLEPKDENIVHRFEHNDENVIMKYYSEFSPPIRRIKDELRSFYHL